MLVKSTIKLFIDFTFYKAYHNEKSIIDQECADSLIKESKTLSDIFQSRRSINDKVYEEVPNNH